MMSVKDFFDKLDEFRSRNKADEYGTDEIFVLKEKKHTKNFYFIEDLQCIDGQYVIILGEKVG
jgi:hypothetical protein